MFRITRLGGGLVPENISHNMLALRKKSGDTADPQGQSNEDLKQTVSIVTPGAIALRPTPVPKRTNRIQ